MCLITSASLEPCDCADRCERCWERDGEDEIEDLRSGGRKWLCRWCIDIVLEDNADVERELAQEAAESLAA
jgi:hypothetical protein